MTEGSGEHRLLRNRRFQGDANILLILGIIRQAGEIHGYAIRRKLIEETNGMVALKAGTLYPILTQMRKAKWIRGSKLAPGTRRTRLLSLTDRGRLEYKKRMQVFQGITLRVQELQDRKKERKDI